MTQARDPQHGSKGDARSAHPARVAALGGGKGGIGRTTLTVELARALARHGRSVLIVEIDPRARTLPAVLEMETPPRPRRGEAAGVFKNATTETPIQNVHLIALADGPELMQRTDPQRALERVRELMLRLHEAPFDWILLDLPAGFGQGALTLFTAADVPLLLTTSEPAALVSATAWLRGCVLASVAQHQSAEVTQAVRTAARRHPAGWTFAELHADLDAPTAGVLEDACERLTIGLVLNQVREASELEQAVALCHGWAMMLGVWPRTLGGIGHDDRRWFFARRLAPANHHPRDDSLAGDTDRLARHLLEIDWQSWSEPIPCLPQIDADAEPRLFLDIDDEVGSNVRQRYRRLWEGYRREAGLVSQVLDADWRRNVIGLLEIAYRRINRDDDTPIGASGAHATVSRSSPSLRQHPGQRIRLARMRQGLGLRELSLRTRVGVKHINAIEACIVRELPSRVYLEAYLAQIASTLGMQSEQLVTAYLAFLDATDEA